MILCDFFLLIFLHLLTSLYLLYLDNLCLLLLFLFLFRWALLLCCFMFSKF